MLVSVVHAQDVDPANDHRVAPEVIRYINANASAPVIVVVGGRLQEARDVWQSLRRQVRGGYGQLAGPPNARGEFFAELNRFGLMLALTHPQVEAIFLTFEATRPGEEPDPSATAQ